LILAFVSVKVESGKDEEVLKEVRKIVGVQRAIPTYGIYDLLIEVSLKDMKELDSFIFDKLRRIPGVKETVTQVASRGI